MSDWPPPPLQQHGGATAVSHQGELVEIPLISSLFPSLCIRPSIPLPPTGQGKAALLLLTLLHKRPKRGDEEQGAKVLSEKLSQVYILRK